MLWVVLDALICLWPDIGPTGPIDVLGRWNICVEVRDRFECISWSRCGVNSNFLLDVFCMVLSGVGRDSIRGYFSFYSLFSIKMVSDQISHHFCWIIPVTRLPQSWVGDSRGAHGHGPWAAWRCLSLLLTRFLCCLTNMKLVARLQIALSDARERRVKKRTMLQVGSKTPLDAAWSSWDQT